MTSASTTIVFRSCGGITGLREAIDETANLSVIGFPIEQLNHVVATRSLAFPACYILAGPSTAYVGESGNVAIRLAQHFTDQTKNFATEAFVIGATNERCLDKTAAIYLQHYVSKAIEASALVGLTKGKSPQPIELLLLWRRSSLRAIGAKCAAIVVRS